MKKKKNRKNSSKFDIFDKIKLSDKVLKIIWIIALVLFVLLFIRYEKNKWFVKWYNKGVKYYKEADYELAESYFTDALYENPKGRRDCKCRINLALSIVKPITPESVNSENFDECIERLETAKTYLTENNCAHETDSKGHSKKAQTLKEEIDEYIQQLIEQSEKEKEEQEDDNKDDQNQQGSGEAEKNDTDEIDSRYEEIKQMMESDQKTGQEERFRQGDLYENWGNFTGIDERSW